MREEKSDWAKKENGRRGGKSAKMIGVKSEKKIDRQKKKQKLRKRKRKRDTQLYAHIVT